VTGRITIILLHKLIKEFDKFAEMKFLRRVAGYPSKDQTRRTKSTQELNA
jgi:hypothetical protein